VKPLIILFALFLTGCTEADESSLLSNGDYTSIKCWSAEMLVYDGVAAGKVDNPNGNVFYFVDRADNKMKSVSGNCIIIYSDKK